MSMLPILRLFIVVLTLACLFLPSQASAQSLLQNTGGTLQPQGNQAQSTNNSQNQTGSPQNSGNQSALNQQNNQPLGVVSNPQQSNPDTVTQPSSELRASSSTLRDSSLSTPVKFLLGFLAVFLIVFFVAYRFSRLDFEEIGSFNESQTTADSGNQRRTKIKKPKKKRRKPHQR